MGDDALTPVPGPRRSPAIPYAGWLGLALGTGAVAAGVYFRGGAAGGNGPTVLLALGAFLLTGLDTTDSGRKRFPSGIITNERKLSLTAKSLSRM